MTMSSPGSDLQQAAAWLRAADGLLITAGAGMGIDSGLPDFRGPGGFWAAYPALGRARKSRSVTTLFKRSASRTMVWA